MAYVTTGLPNNGRTQYFNIQYDDSLSQARGLDLAADVMNYCDNDLSQVAAWFSGRALDMSPPIHVSFTTVATDADGNPTQTVGGQWKGATVVPLQVTINIGEFPMGSGTPTMLARYLLVSEVSEMYMRAFGAHGPNPWFRFSEGNKGEGLSRFLAAQFLLKAYPGVAAIPTLLFPAGAGRWNVTNFWLDSPRVNFLEVNDEDIDPDPVTGCATLFLFYLHDQLGYRIEDIINAGAGHLSNVYENLTGDSWTNAWGKFSGLVNLHYPNSLAPARLFVPSYAPPLDSIFPVSDLTKFSATPQVSWVPAAMPPVMSVLVDQPAKVPLPISTTSSHPAIVPPPSVTISPSATSAVAPLTVMKQAAGFTSALVTLTASYASRTLTSNVRVVSPDSLGLPALEIDVDRSTDPCQPLFVEGTPQLFRINNLSVFADQAGLSFSWSVTGAKPGAINTPSLRISTLPAARSKVRVRVTVTNAQGLRATGALSFKTVALDLKVLAKELRCRLSRLQNFNLSIPPWNPIEEAGSLRDRLDTLEKQVRTVSRAAASVTKVIRSMKPRR